MIEQVEDRIYKEDHCWQYDIRLNNLDGDTKSSGLTKKEIKGLKASSFDLDYFIPKEDKAQFHECRSFIERHEWLGTMSLHPTHIFTARYKGILCGIIVMEMPVAFTKLLGDDSRKVEKLISRGACISWSPVNLASRLLMYSVKWMVANTRFRLFMAYSDTEAKELGTIYQACNFTYIGKSAGTSKKYKLPDGRWKSDRYLRTRSAYKRYAKIIGIVWDQDKWMFPERRDSINWEAIPDDIVKRIKDEYRRFRSTLESRNVVAKHKYIYILGEDKRETSKLRNKFKEINPKLVDISYPKDR